jgi:N-methylhydantoinase B
VMEDVRRDVVSVEHARAAYGVAIVDGGIDAEATAALRAAPREQAEDFDFGPEREAHERVWSPAMYEKLAAILAELPQATRPHARLALFKAVGEELEDADPDALAAIWGRIGERLRGRR